jgi:hypothetical protein
MKKTDDFVGARPGRSPAAGQKPCPTLEVDAFMVVNRLSFIVVFGTEHPGLGCYRLRGFVGFETLKKLLLPLG